jgi:hypothetical protein
VAISLAGCGGAQNQGKVPEQIQLSGKTSFISIDGNTTTFNTVTADNAALVSSNSARTVIEGDIYRVLDAGKSLLNLNSTRGLQIIDLSNAAAPKIVGRVAISGTPVEMYHAGNRVYALLNEWSEYLPVMKDGKEALDSFHGGVIATIDISDRTKPKLLSSSRIPGYIQSSRMSAGNGKSALYIAARRYDIKSGDSEVRSFVIDSQGNLQSKTSLSLGGQVSAIQAANDRLMVASGTFDTWGGGGIVFSTAQNTASSVSIIDISSPDGIMIKGASITMAGIVQQKNNMHIQGNIMRVVSGIGGDIITDVGSATSANANKIINHVETFDISDISRPIPIDHDTFGTGQQLYGTTFMADRAFFVTYQRTDPFHAFSITPQGVMQEENEFIVSGWNNFFVPVRSNTRLIGIGNNDENNRRTLAISLYDVSNLKNKQPLITRAELDLNNSWSEANWDDRAFTVLDNATNAIAADGKTVETGLVMLPFTGWDPTLQSYESGVQLFSFSANTITRRGIMTQDSPVRRTFMGEAGADLAINLGYTELTVFGMSNVNTPALKSTLQLTPNYSQFLAFANIGARYRAVDFSWWGNQLKAPRSDMIDIVALNDADNNPAIASIKVPAGSKMFNFNGILAIVSTSYVAQETITTVSTYDVSIPSAPRLLGSISTNQIKPSTNYFTMDALVCNQGRCNEWPQSDTVELIGSKLVFSRQDFISRPENNGRSSMQQSFSLIDLSKAAQPVLLPMITMSKDEEAVTMLQTGGSLWVNYKKLQKETGPKGESMVKYYVKELNFDVAGTVIQNKEINIPGKIMAISGNQFYTLETNYESSPWESTIHKLQTQNGLAYLQSSFNLGDQMATSLKIDGDLLAMTSYNNRDYQFKTSVFESRENELILRSTIDAKNSVNLEYLGKGKLLIGNSYGFLLYDITNVNLPTANAFFPAKTWSSKLQVINNDIYLAANTYGIYQFNLNTRNLERK